MILNYQQIVQAVEKKQIVIEPFQEENVQAASYDMRVGKQGATVSRKKLLDLEKERYLMLEPGDTGIIVSLEAIHLDHQHTGRFGLRSKYTRKGLIASTGPQIDPGFEGRIILTITNLSLKAVVLPYKEALMTVEFHRLEEPTSHPYQGEYQGRFELGAEEMEFILEQESISLPEIIKTLGILAEDVKGLRDSVKALRDSVNSLKWSIPLIVGFGIAVIAALVALRG